MIEKTSGPGHEPASPPRCRECGAPQVSNDAPNEEITHCEWCGAEYPVPVQR